MTPLASATKVAVDDHCGESPQPRKPITTLLPGARPLTTIAIGSSISALSGRMSKCATSARAAAIKQSAVITQMILCVRLAPSLMRVTVLLAVIGIASYANLREAAEKGTVLMLTGD